MSEEWVASRYTKGELEREPWLDDDERVPPPDPEKLVRRTFDSDVTIAADEAYTVYEANYDEDDDVFHAALDLHYECVVDASHGPPPEVMWELDTHDDSSDFARSVAIPSSAYVFYNDGISGKELFTYNASASTGAAASVVRFQIRAASDATYTIKAGTTVTLGIRPNKGVMDDESFD